MRAAILVTAAAAAAAVSSSAVSSPAIATAQARIINCSSKISFAISQNDNALNANGAGNATLARSYNVAMWRFSIPAAIKDCKSQVTAAEYSKVKESLEQAAAAAKLAHKANEAKDSARALGHEAAADTALKAALAAANGK